MPNNARLTDIWAGICVCHIPPVGMAGPIVTASDNVIINNLGAARLHDVVIGFCGHPGIIVAASNDVIINNRGAARIGDPVVGCTIGAIVTGSENTKSDG